MVLIDTRRVIVGGGATGSLEVLNQVSNPKKTVRFGRIASWHCVIDRSRVVSLCVLLNVCSIETERGIRSS